MPAFVRRAAAEDLDQVYSLLRDSSLQSAGLPLDVRKRMFQSPWASADGHHGFVLDDDGQVVGFLGLLFTNRQVQGQVHKFCEIHSWYVKEDYRHKGLELFFSALTVDSSAILNYTPNRAVYDISTKFGFEELESRVLLFLPIPTLKSLGLGVTVERRSPELMGHLTPHDRQILHDHQDSGCHHFLIRHKSFSRYLYVVLKKMKGTEADVLPRQLRWLEPFGRILYLSDEELFAETIDFLRMYWCLRYGLRCLLIDHSQLTREISLRHTREIRRDVPSLFKSRGLTPAEIGPPLYTFPLLVGYGMH